MEFFGIDLTSLVKASGYIGLFAIIFAESGLLVGFFLPGDSLLFTAGFLASQGFLDIRVLVLLMFLAAVLGDNFGYAFGRRVGPVLFKRPDARFFRKEYLKYARTFYQEHGKKTIMLARFIPAVRTFAPIIAGVSNMHYPSFLTYNLVGGMIWGIGIPLLGYYLGSIIPHPDRYLLPIVILIIIVSMLPGVFHIKKVLGKKKVPSQ